MTYSEDVNRAASTDTIDFLNARVDALENLLIDFLNARVDALQKRVEFLEAQVEINNKNK